MPSASANNAQSRLTSMRPLPTAFAAAGISAGILATIGALTLGTARRIMERDATEIFAAATQAATTGPRSALLSTNDTTMLERVRGDAGRALDAIRAALPEAVAVQVGGIHGDSLKALVEYVSPEAEPDARPTQALGVRFAMPPEARASLQSGKPNIATVTSAFGRPRGFRAFAPITGPDGRMTGYMSVTADARRYARWEDDIRQTIYGATAIILFISLLAGLVTYRVESSRAESAARLIEAKDAAEAVARSRGEFLANMSHEIRTPLHGVLGMTEALLASQHTEADRRSLTVINRSASSLLGILNDILDYSKLEAGRIELVHAAFDPRALVDDVTDLFAVRAEEKGLDLAVRESARADHWPVGDAARIRQVMLNLVGNAVKFTEAGSVQVELSTVAIGRKTIALRIGVKDTGIGMSPDVQSRVFEQFSQGDASTARRFGGTGLGLTISRQLVLLMGGEITVTSVQQKGSDFTIVLQLPASDTKVEVPVIRPIAAGTRAVICTPHTATAYALSELCTRERLSFETYANIADAQSGMKRTVGAAIVFCDAALAPPDALHPLYGPHPLVMLTTVHAPLNNSSLALMGAVAQLRRPVRQDHFTALIGDLAGGKYAVPPRPATPTRTTTPPRAKPAVADQDAADGPATPGKQKVLVVDDVEMNLMVAKAMLASLGVTVLTAAGGEAALDMLSREPMDLVFMDCHMPGLDGYDVTRCLRATDGPNRDVPVVALSASAFQDDRDRAIACGMNDFATKPIELGALKAVLVKWAGTRNAVPVQAGG